MNAPENLSLQPPYPSFSTRMLAVTVDIFILVLFAVPIINMIMDAVFTPFNLDPFSKLFENQEMLEKPYQLMGTVWEMAKQQHVMERAITDNLLQFLSVSLYTLPFWLRYSATPGKMLCRLVICDARTGMRMSRRQAWIRFFGYIVSFLPLTTGFIWIAMNKKRQGFHDLIADTIVVAKPKKIAAPDEPGTEPSTL